VPDDRVLELADIILDIAPHVPIVLVRDNADVVSEEAKQAGVREVIDSAISELDMERLLTRFFAPDDEDQADSGSGEPQPAAEVVPALDPDQHRVIVVLSPKGGVGKTTTSTNLAVALSQSAPLDTVLVDYDAQFGDVSSMLNINPAHTIEEAFTENAVHPTLVIKGLLVNYENRLLALAGSDSPAAMEKVTGPQATTLIDQLSQEYSYVVVDTGSGLTDEALAALEVATDVVFVTTMDVSSVKALRRSADLLDRLDLLPRNRSLIVNMADPGTGLTTEDISAAMRMEVDVTIPRSTDVILSVNVGKPLAQGRGSSPFMEGIDAIVAKIRGSESRPKSGLLKKRLGT